jgi:ribonuclease HII
MFLSNRSCHLYICGVDEAGRGPLAGPVTAAAVILPDRFPPLNDSKKLTPQKRDRAASLIREKALAYSIGWSWPQEIDKINIHHATLLAMKRAILGLRIVPVLVLVDGKFPPPVHLPCLTIIKGDRFIPQIQAASIMAKVTRDAWMKHYARIESNYLFEQNKGYPTKMHRAMIKKYGPSPIHRQSFRVSDVEI